MKSLKLANIFFYGLSAETQDEMFDTYSESGFDSWDGFLLDTVQDYMKAECVKKDCLSCQN